MSVSELGPYHARSGIDRFLHPRRYGGPNYAAFDVANHSWCGRLDDSATPRFDRYRRDDAPRLGRGAARPASRSRRPSSDTRAIDIFADHLFGGSGRRAAAPIGRRASVPACASHR